MVKHLVVFLVVVLPYVAAGPVDPDANDVERIVNASTPNPPMGTLPYLVSVKVDTTHVCSGWIHNNGWVITAASCVYGKLPNQVTVVVAQTSLITPTADEVTYNVFSIRANPSYDNTTRVNDIALLEMSKSIVFGANVGAISFEQPEQTPNSLLIAGFGATFPLGPISTVLRKTSVTLDTFSANCAGASPFDPLNMFCAGTGDTTGPCKGDEGSPAVQVLGGTERVVGIVSNNLNCGKGTPTVYTMVSSYYAWILDIAGRPGSPATGR